VLVAVVSSLLPSVPRYLPIFPFLNPQIAIDVWPVATVLSVVSGLIAYGSARGPSPSRAALAVGALILAVFMVVVMMYLAADEVISASLYARIGFLCFFVCIAVPVGWVVARIPSTRH
jgi:hypothetical protein